MGAGGGSQTAGEADKMEQLVQRKFVPEDIRDDAG